MGFSASTREADGVTVIDARGSITLTEGSALCEMLADMLNKGRKKILINMADVEYIDSSGIRELVAGYTAIKEKGGQLKMLQLTKKVREMLEVTKLAAVFEDYSDEQTAIRSFR